MHATHVHTEKGTDTGTERQGQGHGQAHAQAHTQAQTQTHMYVRNSACIHMNVCTCAVDTYACTWHEPAYACMRRC
jgi:hypothetical protein